MSRTPARPGPRCGRLVLVLLVAACAAAPAAQALEDPLRDQQWGLDAVHAADAHRIARGSGALVAVLDTGVEAGHPDLAGAVAVGPDFADGTGAGQDPNGHGTHVAGIVAAHEGNGVGGAGGAPDARVLSIRVLGADKSGTTDAAAEGIDAAVAAHADVINLSLTAGPNAPQDILPTSPIVRAIDRAADAGVVVVAAAGNDALPLCEQPLVRGRILCVGAVDNRLQSSDFTNFGVRVDLVAPGGSADGQHGTIISTYRAGTYAGMSGTSQATPFVAAAAALLVSIGLRGTAVIDRILATTRDLGAPGQDATYGAGLLDMGAAVGAQAQATPAPTPSPSEARAASGRRPVVSAPGRLRLRTFLRSGLRVRCRLAAAGTCLARLTDPHRRLVARRAVHVTAGRFRTIRLRATRAARRRLARRHGRALTLRLTVGASDATVRRSVRLTSG